MNKKLGGLMTAALATTLWFARAAAQEAEPAADKPLAQEAAEVPPKPEIKPETKSETAKPEPKPEHKAEPKSESKPDAKPESKPETKSEPKAEAKPESKPEPKVEPKPEPKPEARPEPKAEPKSEPEPKAEAPAKPVEKALKAETAKKPEAPKELTPCAKTFMPLADSYKKAYEELLKWIDYVDAQTAAATSKIERIQEQIEKNEASITKLKLQGTRESSAKGRDLDRDNKLLWSDLSATRKERSALCAGFAREAVQKARQYQSDILEKLESVKAQTR